LTRKRKRKNLSRNAKWGREEEKKLSSSPSPSSPLREKRERKRIGCGDRSGPQEERKERGKLSSLYYLSSPPRIEKMGGEKEGPYKKEKAGREKRRGKKVGATLSSCPQLLASRVDLGEEKRKRGGREHARARPLRKGGEKKKKGPLPSWPIKKKKRKKNKKLVRLNQKGKREKK